MALTDNLVSYYKFDVDSSTQDDAHGSNDGTVTNATYNASGALNGCYQFDAGGEYVSVSNQLVTGTAFSISFWWKRTTTGTTDVLLWAGDANDDTVFGVRFISNYLYLQWSEGTTTDWDAQYRSTSTKTSTSWKHWVWTRDGTTVKLYEDGNEITITTLEASGGSAVRTATTNICYIGDSYGKVTDADGQMDELGFWTRALSGTEVTQLYNSGTPLAYPLTVSSGTNFQLNIGDAWKTVDGLQINIGDAWKTVDGAQVNIGDAWKTIF